MSQELLGLIESILARLPPAPEATYDSATSGRVPMPDASGLSDPAKALLQTARARLLESAARAEFPHVRLDYNRFAKGALLMTWEHSAKELAQAFADLGDSRHPLYAVRVRSGGVESLDCDESTVPFGYLLIERTDGGRVARSGVIQRDDSRVAEETQERHTLDADRLPIHYNTILKFPK
jgi:hypothetical protein